MDHMVVDILVLVLEMVVVDNHIFLLLGFCMHLNLLYLNQLYLKRIHHHIIQILDKDQIFY
jgi:hypothetical protein